MKILIKNNFYW